jgi:hypothetical protein
MQISRIRLSDKTSRLHPRHVVPKPAQAYEPEVIGVADLLASIDVDEDGHFRSLLSFRRPQCAGRAREITPYRLVHPDEKR